MLYNVGMVDDSRADFLQIGDAAEYVGVSTQTLRRWDSEGRLSAVRRPGNNYRYYRRGDLEPFRLEYRRAADAVADPGKLFQVATANIEGNDLLREPQRDAHRAVREHFEKAATPAIVQIPVGCGKTGIMATLPFGIASGRTLVITPNLTIRKGVASALDIASRECFWAKTRVLPDFSEGPYFAVLESKDANLHDCTESHFVLTNIQQLASSADRWLPQFPPNFFDLILVDEGHHAAAASWQKVFRRFPDAKVVSLTATPFRADEQPLQGELIYRYPFAKAMMKGFIKQIHARRVEPSELYFTYAGDTVRHTLDEVLQLREEQWFRRGVALSPECNRHIAESSIQRCNALRAATGNQHQIIAAACSVDHARQVRAIYEECGYRAAEIHSGLSDDAKEAVLDKLATNQIDCIVQVQMLGEGFDHPRLSVAAVFRPFRSLAPYIQFVGRVMRVVIQDEPEHPDNEGFVVSHIGLNNDARWDEFRELDLDDQALLREWLSPEEADDVTTEPEEGSPRRFDQGVLVERELVAHFIDQPFLDPTDDRVLDQMLSQSIAPGILLRDVVDREAFRSQLLAKALKTETPAAIPIIPQRRRQAARKRLDERAKSVAARVLKDLGLSRQGWEISKVSKGPPGNNSTVLIRLLNREVAATLGIGLGARKNISAEEAESALASLDAIGDTVRDRIAKSMEA
jgi:excisionase family DNA binding protein